MRLKTPHCLVFSGLLLMLPLLVRAEVLVDAWARATPTGSDVGAMYGELTNRGTEAMTVLDVVVPLARHVAIHETRREEGVMRMTASEISLAPHRKMTLRPGGVHIMLTGLMAPLEEGCHYPFSIRWVGGAVTEHRFVAGGMGQMTKPEPGKACPG